MKRTALIVMMAGLPFRNYGKGALRRSPFKNKRKKKGGNNVNIGLKINHFSHKSPLLKIVRSVLRFSRSSTRWRKY